MISLTCSLGSVAAMRAGMMNDGLADGLPRASSTRPNGCSSSMTNVFASTGAILPMAAIMSRPTASLAPQRRSEATQSSAVTAVPSWNFRPSRSVKEYFMESRLTVHLSTICGLSWRLPSKANSVSKIM
jgi:hypothetical protein